MIATPPHWFAVVSIRSGCVRYRGANLSKAAIALKPGNVYGKGTSGERAVRAAREQAARMRGLTPATRRTS